MNKWLKQPKQEKRKFNAYDWFFIVVFALFYGGLIIGLIV